MIEVGDLQPPRKGVRRLQLEADVDGRSNAAVPRPQRLKSAMPGLMAVTDQRSQFLEIRKALQLWILIVLDQRRVGCVEVLSGPQVAG